MTDHVIAALGGILGGSVVMFLMLFCAPRHLRPDPNRSYIV